MIEDTLRMLAHLMNFREEHDRQLRSGVAVPGELTNLRDQATEVLLDHGIELEVE